MPHPYLHTDVVFHPNWWNKNYGLAFDRGFFYDIDYGTPDEAIRAMFETVARYRGDHENPIPRAYEVA
jgi:hypothetical protein